MIYSVSGNLILMRWDWSYITNSIASLGTVKKNAISEEYPNFELWLNSA